MAKAGIQIEHLAAPQVAAEQKCDDELDFHDCADVKLAWSHSVAKCMG
jgi:hypothetical protein